MTARPVWLNGALLPSAQARIEPGDRGFTLGDGVFETVAVRQGSPAYLARHLDRLEHGAAALAIACAWDRPAIARAVVELIAAAGRTEGSLRITLSRGPALRGLLPGPAGHATLLITWSDHAHVPDGVVAIICRTTCRNQASPLARIKSLNYLDSVLARMEAAAAGAGDAVMLNTNGHVAEATAANLFAVLGERLVTPPVADGALPGIARALLIERAGALERRLSPDDVHQADALILTSSLGLRQITRLDDTLFAPAPELLEQLRAGLRQGRGLRPLDPSWGNAPDPDP